jgi:hypothetical protein
MWFPWFNKLIKESHKTQEMLQQHERAIHDTAESAEKKQREMGVVIAGAIEKAAGTVPQYEENQRDKEYSLQRGLFWVTLAGAIFAAAAASGAWYYAHIAAQQRNIMTNTLCEMQKQTGLLSAQIKGTEAAFVNVVAEVGNQVGNFDRPFNQVFLVVQNTGHAIANDVSVDVSIQLMSITGKPIAPAHTFTYYAPALDFKPGTSEDTRRFVWDSDAHASKTIEAVKSLKFTARKQWSFEYKNGFGETIKSNTLCQELLIAEWVSCDNFPIKLRSLNENNSAKR